MKAGTGKITVNDRPLDEFFGRETGRMIVRQPLETRAARQQVRLHRVGVGRRHHRPGRRHSPRHHARAHGIRPGAAQGLCALPASSRATRAKSSARRSAAARRVVDRSTPSVNLFRRLGASIVRRRPVFGRSSSGRTTDSDSVYLGSNPSLPTNMEPARLSSEEAGGFLFPGVVSDEAHSHCSPRSPARSCIAASSCRRCRPRPRS